MSSNVINGGINGGINNQMQMAIDAAREVDEAVEGVRKEFGSLEAFIAATWPQHEKEDSVRVEVISTEDTSV